MDVYKMTTQNILKNLTSNKYKNRKLRRMHTIYNAINLYINLIHFILE